MSNLDPLWEKIQPYVVAGAKIVSPPFIQRAPFYYPCMYLTLFLQGHLELDSLQLRRFFALTKIVNNIIHGTVDSAYILHRLLRSLVSNEYGCTRYHVLARGVRAYAGVPKHTGTARPDTQLRS